MEPREAPSPSHTTVETFPGDTWEPRRKDYGDPIKPHPMFPLDEDQPQETRRIYFITILRKNDENGIPERCPKRFAAEELREQGWSAIVHRYGRGWYRAEGTSSCYVKQAFTDWQYFAGPDPRPFYDEPTGSPASMPAKAGTQPQPAQTAAQPMPAPAGFGSDWIAMIQLERERTERERERVERSLEAERERNQRLLEIMLAKSNTPPPPPPPFPIKELLEVAKPAPLPIKELLEIAKGSQPQLTIKDMLEFARTIPQQGGLKELRDNLDVLEALGIGRNNTPSADTEGAMAKDLISTVQSVISTVKTNADSAPSPPPAQQAPPAPNRARGNMATVIVQGLGEVLVPEERLQGIMIAQQAQAQTPPQTQAQPATSTSSNGSNNGTPPPAAPPPASPAPPAAPPPDDRIAALSAQFSELQSALSRITAFLVAVFGQSPNSPAPPQQPAEAVPVQQPPAEASASPSAPASAAPASVPPPSSTEPTASPAEATEAAPASQPTEAAKPSTQAQDDDGTDDGAEEDDDEVEARAESDRDPLITPPPALPSPDQIDQMLSMPEMLDMLPPDLRQQTEQIRTYYRNQVRSA